MTKEQDDNTCIFREYLPDGALWECSGCEESWVFGTNCPVESNFHYCPACGRRIIGESNFQDDRVLSRIL